MSDSIPYQDPEFFSETLVQPVSFALLDREFPGVVRRLRVVGHSEIFESPIARGFCHRLQGCRHAMRCAARIRKADGDFRGIGL
jgi:hypothetical protein